MQGYQALSSEMMMKFASRVPGGPRCAHCGQRYHLSFSGGRLAEQRCACGTTRRTSLTATDSDTHHAFVIADSTAGADPRHHIVSEPR